MALDYIKTEWKKLGSMGLIGFGSFLILEHIYSYGGVDLFDILGHEWMGIVLIVVGLLAANKWGALKMREGLALAWEKLGYVFGKA